MTKSKIQAFKVFYSDFYYGNRDTELQIGVEYKTGEKIKFRAYTEPLLALKEHPHLLYNRYCIVELMDAEEVSCCCYCYASRHFKIQKEISVQEFINMCINYQVNKFPNLPFDDNQQIDVVEKINTFVKSNANFATIKSNSKDYADIVSIGRSARINVKGDLSKIISSGDYARILVAGKSSIVASNANNATIETNNNGERAIILSNGDEAKIISNAEYDGIISNGFLSEIISYEYRARIYSQGVGAEIHCNGQGVEIRSLGDNAFIETSGDYAKVTTDGQGSVVSSSGLGDEIISNGSFSKIISVGHSVDIVSKGDFAKIFITNDCATIDSRGHNSTIICQGAGSKVRAKVGSYITTIGVTSDKREPLMTHTERVDGVHIKGDTWYIVREGEFEEVE